jgi:DNA-binding NarL/FixJ family response regulator
MIPRPKGSGRLVIAVVPDLFFATRIAATALAAGVALEMAPPQGALARITGGRPDMVVIDLHAKDGVTLVLELKAAAPTVPIVGFHSHVDTEIRRQALAAGADAVLPRSRFNARLAEILQHGLLALRPADLP